MAVPAISCAGLAEHGFLCCWDTVSQGWRGALSGLNSWQLLQDGSRVRVCGPASCRPKAELGSLRVRANHQNFWEYESG